MKKAIVTIATTDTHKSILAETLGLMKEYAERIGAEIHVVTSDDPSIRIGHYRKIKVLNEILDRYDRVLWIDADVLISRKAPDIFAEVPEDCLGIFNEAPWIDRSNDAKIWFDLTGFAITPNVYFNTGIMVLSKIHKDIFRMPDIQVQHYGEQTYLNQRIAECNTKVYYLSHHWNRMSCTHLPLGEEVFFSNFIHFAGMPHDEKLYTFIKHTISEWQNRGWTGEKRVEVLTSNGMGNQVATVPVILNFLKLYPEYKLTIKSAFPEVFAHLKSDRVEVLGAESNINHPFALKKSTAFAGGLMFDVCMHPTNFHSLAFLKKELHWSDKRITVPRKYCGKKLPPKTVVIHAARSGWASKDMPKENWQNIVNTLKANNLPVALIGMSEMKVKGNVGDRIWGCHDLDGVDFKLIDIPYAETCDVIGQGDFLLTNDSMQVHAAGAFDNHIGLITIAKRPELILPYRTADNFWKATVWTGKPLWELPGDPLITPPDHNFAWNEMHPGMEWPHAAEVATDILKILT